MSLQGQAVLYPRMVNFLTLGGLGCQTGRAGPTEGDNKSAQTGQCYGRHLALGPATHKSHSPVRPQSEDASCLLAHSRCILWLWNFLSPDLSILVSLPESQQNQASRWKNPVAGHLDSAGGNHHEIRESI